MAGALGRPRGMGQGGRWEGDSGWGTHVNPWLIHVNVWHKPLQYCNQPLTNKNKWKKMVFEQERITLLEKRSDESGKWI